MTGDRVRLGRGTLLLGLALVMAKLLVTGAMSKYMAPALDPLSALTAVVLAAMGAFELVGAGRARLLDGDAGAAAGRAGSGVEEALTSLLLVLVLVVGFLVTPRALGSSGLGGERVAGLLVHFGPIATRPPDAGSPAASATLDDFGAVLAHVRQAGEAAVGRRVRIVGTIAPSDELAPGEVAVLRYTIAHCVADARPLALVVVAPRDAEIDGLAADQWIEVEGVVAVRERAGDRLVSIVASRVRPTEEPPNPYLSAAY